MISVVLKREKECLGSVRFSLTKDEIKGMTEAGNPPPVTNVYISRAVPEVATAREVTVLLQVGRAPSPEDAKLLAAIG